jgi:hypothetical protein
MDVDLPVFESGFEIFDIVFIGERGSIFLETLLHLFAFSLSQEASTA